MAYTYLKAEVKTISMAELEALQNAYAKAKRFNQAWIMQAMQKVLDDIDLGIVRVVEREAA